MSNPLDNLDGANYASTLRVENGTLILASGVSEYRLRVHERVAKAFGSTVYTLVPEATIQALKTLKCLRSFCGGCEMNPKPTKGNENETVDKTR